VQSPNQSEELVLAGQLRNAIESVGHVRMSTSCDYNEAVCGLDLKSLIIGKRIRFLTVPVQEEP
jgi:hypothetical protein